MSGEKDSVQLCQTLREMSSSWDIAADDFSILSYAADKIEELEKENEELKRQIAYTERTMIYMEYE